MASEEPVPFVFVSYTQPDEPWAKWVCATLRDAGLTATMQAGDSRPGDNFVLWIGRQLAGARWIVCLYSAAYFASRWCTVEWTSALTRQTLLPVRIEPVDPPSPLDTISWIDVFGVEEPVARERLFGAVGSHVLPRLVRQPSRSTTTTFPGTGAGGGLPGAQNLITGTVRGNVVQARDVHGGISFGGGGRTG